MSANGQVIAAASAGGTTIEISRDGGSTWTALGASAAVAKVVLSSDGTKLAYTTASGVFTATFK